MESIAPVLSLVAPSRSDYVTLKQQQGDGPVPVLEVEGREETGCGGGRS